MPHDLYQTLKAILKDVALFSQYASGVKLRSYQEQVAYAVVDSVIHQRGLSFVVMFPRQSGKNELQAQLEVYLLMLFSQLNAEMVKVSPTWKPQAQNAMRRLERVLARNLITRERWSKEGGYIYRIGNASLTFLSGEPTSHVVGATASTLLQCDEAQDVQIAKWDKDFAPMAASTHATRLFWGTAWTNQTLLAREYRAARQAEQADGIRRVFHLSAEQVAQEVPAYGRHVQEQIARLGRNHPLVRTQYFSEEIEAQAAMFPPERRALMQGDHPHHSAPLPQAIYAFLLDVAGTEESSPGLRAEPAARRDATALTIVQVDLASLQDELSRAPTYRVVKRHLWVGCAHSQLYAEIKALAALWQPRTIVIDATGVGAGLASFLAKAFPQQVIPFVFSQKSKSDLGYRFLAICDSGRFKDHRPHGEEHALFWRQLEFVQYEAGLNHSLKWSVPEGTRHPIDGELLHDDLVLSAALVAVLDEQEWSLSAPTLIIRSRDPLQDMDKGRF